MSKSLDASRDEALLHLYPHILHYLVASIESFRVSHIRETLFVEMWMQALHDKYLNTFR